MLGYVLSIFALQLTITTVSIPFTNLVQLMVQKHTEKARIVFAFMVPITIIAFLLGYASTDAISFV